jgi:predicted nucleotidyltransferase component of viral defense system
LAKLASIHWEALTPNTRAAFRKTAKFSNIQSYYLAGGTGLALHLGHRYSIDLDFFSPDPHSVSASEREELRELFRDRSLTITHDKDSTFVASWRKVGISFFRVALYPLVETPLEIEGVPLATIPEIGAMKLAAVIDRGTRKDLVDLFYILQIVPIEKIFRVAARKYARVRTFPISAIRGLAYFDEAETKAMPEMIDKTPWRTMKKFLEQQALEAGRKKLGKYWD